MTNWFLFKVYAIQKLPLAFLTGFKIVELDELKCVTRVKYSYLNKNPFRSTFWAVLGMAAELSTGAYALLATKGKEESIAVILVGTHVANDVVEKFVAAVHDNKGELVMGHPLFRAYNPKLMGKKLSTATYHPGAIAYYKKNGIWPGS